MSPRKNITAWPQPATVVKLPADTAYPAKDAFRHLAADATVTENIWREVTHEFARYCWEVGTPISGPTDSGSYACGEHVLSWFGKPIHCIVANEGGKWFAKYASLEDWPKELLALREALS